jgi:hypothetical protein
MRQAPSNPMADGINAATKYDVTHRPESLEWGPVEDLGANIVEDVSRIKSQDGPDIVLWGGSTLTSASSLLGSATVCASAGDQGVWQE